MNMALKASLHIQIIVGDVLILTVGWKKSMERVTHTLVSGVGEATLPHTRTCSPFLWFISCDQNENKCLNMSSHCVVDFFPIR